MIFQVIEFISLILLLLVIGAFWGPWFAIHRSLSSFKKEEFIKITKIMAANMARPMQLLMPSCILFLLLSVFFYPHKNYTGFYLIISSLFCILLTLIVTMTTELPIVNKVKQWTPDTVPDNWEDIRDKWVRFHALRVFPGIISFGLYIAAVLNLF